MKPAAAVISVFSLCAAACSQLPYVPSEASAELRAAIAAAHAAGVGGPGTVRLSERVVLQLQAGLVFIPPAQGGRLLRAMGESPGENVLGVVVSSSPEAAVAVIYARDGDVSGVPDLEVAGWSRAPALGAFRQR